ncbi:unnamed protein product [Orchesella dallaii]|uniref:ABC transporter domain-containing protein n=1 Tax=Orchesella dallaii TaxID=48710 RepID=A0ABP1R8J6_9HEXA
MSGKEGSKSNTMEDNLNNKQQLQQKRNKLPDVVINLNNLKVGWKRLPSEGNKTPVCTYAVNVEGVCKAYGSTKILDNFSMKVRSGEIYSLLGSSGVGKTSLLSCIVGLKKWDSGSITVLGRKQTIYENDFLEIGKCVGYMPQEHALYDHLTVKEMFQYYGKLYGMNSSEITERWKVLVKLLELSSKRYTEIQCLSGGEKRRTSLALALVHKPGLLVLDEPTVGLDPLLRQSIWQHLHELLITQKTTVLLTTHYIEETRFSNTIGMMRNGQLIFEDSPKSLLSTYKSSGLQEAILKMCKNKERSLSATIQSHFISQVKEMNSKHGVKFQYKGRVSPRSSIADGVADEKPVKNVAFCGIKDKNPDEINESLWVEEGGFEMHRMQCNYFKNLAQRTLAFSTVIWIFLIRQPIFAFILLFMPAIQLFMTFFVVGKEPLDLMVGVINKEVLQLGQNYCRDVTFTERSCNLELVSCHVENDLWKNEHINLVPLPSMDAGNELLIEGSMFGIITIPYNYSENLVNRFITGKFATDDETLEGSKLIVTLDKSNYMAYHLIFKGILDALDHLRKNLDSTCGFDQSYNEIPIFFREPVYGELNGTHQESIIPAIVAQILFEIIYGIAPIILIKDIRQGTMARANLAGLRFSEFMLGIFFAMGPLLILQSVSCYFVLEYGFKFHVHGSIFLFVFLCVLTGLCGQAFGIWVGIIVKNEFSLIVSAIMIIPMIMTFSGTLWPLESHPYFLTIIYYIFPSAPIVSSLRSVKNSKIAVNYNNTKLNTNTFSNNNFTII